MIEGTLCQESNRMKRTSKTNITRRESWLTLASDRAQLESNKFVDVKPVKFLVQRSDTCEQAGRRKTRCAAALRTD